MRSLRLRLLLAVMALLVVLPTIALARPYGRVAKNPADRLVAKAIDDYRYDRAKRCRKRPAAGAVALVDWLERNAQGQFWGIMRCEKWGRNSASLHAEGRAIDWHLDSRTAADRRAAKRLIMTLLATDKAGNPHALARRMGVQEIIWNCRSWWSGSERMGPYSQCYTKRGKRRKRVNFTLAHKDHIHIGLNLSGARKRTSFWRR